MNVLQMFSYPFMQRALAAGVLVSLCAALLGVPLVLKRYSMIGDGLSHVSFGALAIAVALGVTPLYFSIPVVILAAFFLLRMASHPHWNSDAAIAAVSASALAVGILVISRTTGMTTDVDNYMFGSVLAMTKGDVALSVVLILAALSVYGTLAYFTAQGTARNVITTGDIKIALEERMLTPDGEKTVPFEDQLGVMPGSDVSKIVTVTNTGGQPAWVRVSLDKAIELARGVEGEADLSLVTCDLNTESWTEKDGYYYYNAALEPGQTTEPLFTAVHFAETMSNMYQESRAILQVNAFATQTAHNGASAMEAAGWPEA